MMSTTSDTLHFAYEYLDRGWPVIPVKGKTPAVPWRAYQRRRPTCADVAFWFASGESYNLAVVTGSLSGLVVIDCDTPEDARWWRAHRINTPLVATTGRGGKHFYYRYPNSKAGNRTGILRKKIDVRGEGGLVVAPPSIHPATKRLYKWEPWGHYVLDEIPVFHPDWCGAARSNFSSGSCAETHRPGVRNGLSYIRQIRAESGHGGHNATFRAACKLRDSGLSAGEALEALKRWNETNAKPPWTEKELAHKVQDAYKGGSS